MFPKRSLAILKILSVQLNSHISSHKERVQKFKGDGHRKINSGIITEKGLLLTPISKKLSDDEGKGWSINTNYIKPIIEKLINEKLISSYFVNDQTSERYFITELGLRNLEELKNVNPLIGLIITWAQETTALK